MVQVSCFIYAISQVSVMLISGVIKALSKAQKMGLMSVTILPF